MQSTLRGSLGFLLLLVIATIVGAPSTSLAQEQKQAMPTPAPMPQATPSPTPTPAPAPVANPNDVASVDSIIAAVYDVISGPTGQKRDWDRMRSLFTPGARLIPTGRRPNGDIVSRARTVEEYIAGSSPLMEKNGFFEREIARRTEVFGSIAHVFSTYDSRHKADDPKPFARGINSIQLFNDGKRWWIVTIFWQGEDEKNPLPEKYLKSAAGESRRGPESECICRS